MNRIYVRSFRWANNVLIIALASQQFAWGASQIGPASPVSLPPVDNTPAYSAADGASADLAIDVPANESVANPGAISVVAPSYDTAQFTADLESLLKKSNPAAFARISKICAEKFARIPTRCTPPPTTIFGKLFKFIGRIVATITRAASRAETALNKKYSTCLLSQTLTSISDVLNAPQYFRLVSLENYESTRKLLYKIKEVLDSKKIKLDADRMKEVDQLIAQMDPYRPSVERTLIRIGSVRHPPPVMKVNFIFNPEDKTYKSVSQLADSKGFNDTDDIRDISLLNDLIFDIEFQSKVNKFVMSDAGKFEAVQKRFKRDKLKFFPQFNEGVKKGVYDSALSFARTLSHPGSRAQDKNIVALRRKILEKSQKLIESAGDPSYQPKFTFDELWALNIDYKSGTNSSLSELHDKEFKGPRHETLSRRITEHFEPIRQAVPIFQKRAAARLENGDILMMAAKPYKDFHGKATGYSDSAQLFFDRTPYLHTAMVLKPEGDDKGQYSQLLHMWGGGMAREPGTSVLQLATIPDSVVYEAHRIHLEKLMTEPLKIMLRRELPRGQDNDAAVEAHLKKKLAAYEVRYRTAMSVGFEDENPLYRIGFDDDRINGSMLPNLSFFRKKKDIYQRAASARSNAYANNADERVDAAINNINQQEANYTAIARDFENQAVTLQQQMDGLIGALPGGLPDETAISQKREELMAVSTQLDTKLAELSDLRGIRVYLEGEKESIARATAARNGQPRREKDSAGNEFFEDIEMCSQLVLNETARRLHFMEDQLKAEYDIRTKQRMFDLSDFDGLDPKRFTPGTLDRLLQKMMARKVVEKLPKDTGLFAN